MYWERFGVGWAALTGFAAFIRPMTEKGQNHRSCPKHSWLSPPATFTVAARPNNPTEVAPTPLLLVPYGGRAACLVNIATGRLEVINYPLSSRQKIPLQVDSFDVDDYRTGDSPSIALLQYATDKQRRPGTRKRSVGTSIVLRALLVSVVKMETNARRAMDRRNKRSHDHATASPSPK